jgi:hypothetical protein
MVPAHPSLRAPRRAAQPWWRSARANLAAHGRWGALFGMMLAPAGGAGTASIAFWKRPTRRAAGGAQLQEDPARRPRLGSCLNQLGVLYLKGSKPPGTTSPTASRARRGARTTPKAATTSCLILPLHGRSRLGRRRADSTVEAQRARTVGLLPLGFARERDAAVRRTQAPRNLPAGLRAGIRARLRATAGSGRAQSAGTGAGTACHTVRRSPAT